MDYKKKMLKDSKELETILPEDMEIRPRDWEGDDVVRCGIY